MTKYLYPPPDETFSWTDFAEIFSRHWINWNKTYLFRAEIPKYESKSIYQYFYPICSRIDILSLARSHVPNKFNGHCKMMNWLCTWELGILDYTLKATFYNDLNLRTHLSIRVLYAFIHSCHEYLDFSQLSEFIRQKSVPSIHYAK